MTLRGFPGEPGEHLRVRMRRRRAHTDEVKGINRVVYDITFKPPWDYRVGVTGESAGMAWS